MHIGKRFKQVRKKLSLTQTKLAEVIGCKQATIADYERERISPSAKVLSIISKNYNININWLLTGSGEMFLSHQGQASKSESSNNVPARAREDEIKLLEVQIAVLKNNITVLQDECTQYEQQNKELNNQLMQRFQELIDTKNQLIKALST
jgi:transcriptional regulator with XRE-family HTH domain